MSANEARPPYVTFERRGVEDRTASLATGYYTTKDVDFATITPPGGRTTVERPVSEWFAQIRRASQEDVGRFPPSWVAHYEQSYDRWKKGEEIPEIGTPIKGWPVLSPAQQQTVLHADIRTVEDLAQATEEGLARIGMGAMALKRRAADFLAARGDGASKASAEMEILRAKLDDALKRNETLEARLQASELAAKSTVKA